MASESHALTTRAAAAAAAAAAAPRTRKTLTTSAGVRTGNERHDVCNGEDWLDRSPTPSTCWTTFGWGGAHSARPHHIVHDWWSRASARPVAGTLGIDDARRRQRLGDHADCAESSLLGVVYLISCGDRGTDQRITGRPWRILWSRVGEGICVIVYDPVTTANHSSPHHDIFTTTDTSGAAPARSHEPLLVGA